MNESSPPKGFPPLGLRDYFAAQALIALAHAEVWNVHEMADRAYRVADAMIEARKHPHKAIEE